MSSCTRGRSDPSLQETHPKRLWSRSLMRGYLVIKEPGWIPARYALNPVILRLVPLWQLQGGCSCIHIAGKAPREVALYKLGVVSLFAAEVLNRPRIHWCECWDCTQYKPLPLCQTWRGYVCVRLAVAPTLDGLLWLALDATATVIHTPAK